MIRRSTWIVVTVFGAVLLAAFLLNASREQATPVETTPTPMPLWTVASEEIVGLLVENLQAGESIELARDPVDLWRTVLPQAGPADAARVEQAVSWLAAPSPRAELPEATDLAPFELAEPAYRVQVSLQDGRTLAFSVGREAPTGGSRYVSLEGRAGVLVVSSFGLEDVLTLQKDLLPTPTPTTVPTEVPTGEPTGTPAASGTALPTVVPTP
jgi:hypothetical protein